MTKTLPDQIFSLRRRYVAAKASHKSTEAIQARLVDAVARQLRSELRAERRQAINVSQSSGDRSAG